MAQKRSKTTHLGTFCGDALLKQKRLAPLPNVQYLGPSSTRRSLPVNLLYAEVTEIFNCLMKTEDRSKRRVFLIIFKFQ